MSIVFMTLFLIAIIALIIVGIKLLIKVNRIHRQIDDILTQFQENPTGKASEILMSVGAGLANAGVQKVKEIIEDKKTRIKSM
jgi:hypothetical protein